MRHVTTVSLVRKGQAKRKRDNSHLSLVQENGSSTGVVLGNAAERIAFSRRRAISPALQPSLDSPAI